MIRVGLGPWGKGIPMMKSDEVVARFTRRAEKLRNIASNVKDREIRSAMLTWATDYDRLAERAIELSSQLDRKYRAGGAPVVKSGPALPAREPGTGDLVHSIDRQSATARRSWWRRTAALHHLGYGLTAVVALAVIAHTLHGGKPGQIP